MTSTTRLVALSLSLILVACDSKATPPPTSASATSGSVTSSQAAGATGGPAATGEGTATGGPSGAGPAPRELPVPTITDPFAIGQALYNPTDMADGVVSLLTLMGVGTYQDDGTPIRVGAVTKAGDPWLFRSEAWGLIDMGIEDLGNAGEDGPTYRLKDLYDALQGLLPADLSLDAFVAAYTDSYAAHPDDLAPSVMLGQPVDATTPLTRTQLWLLYMDGFVDLAPPSGASAVRQGAVAAASRQRSGTANASLPPLTPPQSLSSSQWQELIAHFMTVLDTVPFSVDGGGVHEGHGGPGQPQQITATVARGRGFISPVTGAVILRPGTGALDGLQLAWRSPDVATFNDHGTLAASVPGTGVTDASGIARIAYTPKREVANGAGALAHDAATISATVSARDLLVRAYDIETQSLMGFLVAGTLRGSRTASGATEIAWHGPGIEVKITNVYDVTIDAAQGIGGMVAVAHRTGTDTFAGTLTRRSDGTYRGVLEAHTVATSEMAFGAGLAGDRCDDSTNIVQDLTVTAKLLPQAGLIDSDFIVLESGSYGGQVLVLTFTPKTPPSGEGECQRSVPYVAQRDGGGPVIAGWYASFSDSRITDPSLGGYVVNLPDAGKQLTYFDERQSAKNLPDGTGVDSRFTIEINRQAGS